ncbi:hypothetical protein ACFFRR_008924 [Megaselia abdita]
MPQNKKRKIDIPPARVNLSMSITKGNRFNSLPMEEDLSNDGFIYEVKPSKPPPIIIDSNKNMTSIMTFAGEGYLFKRTSIGTKIMSPNLEKYNELMTKLKSSTTNYFTHRIKNNTFKMILAGLPKLPENSIHKLSLKLQVLKSSLSKK